MRGRMRMKVRCSLCAFPEGRFASGCSHRYQGFVVVVLDHLDFPPKR